MVRLTTRKNLGIEKFSDEPCSSHAFSMDKSLICAGWNDGKKLEHLNSYKVEF